MALTLSSAARLANPNFGNIEQLGQDIGSLSARRRQRGMLTDLLGPALDPMATPEQLRQSALGALNMGRQDVALQLGGMASQAAEKAKLETARKNLERAAIAKAGNNQSLVAALTGAPTDTLRAFLTQTPESRIMNVGGKLAIDEDIYAQERAKGESGDIRKSFILPPSEDGQQKSIFENVPANQLVEIFGDSAGPALVLYGQGKEDEALKTLKPVDRQAETSEQLRDQLNAVDRDLASIDKLIGMDDKGEYWKFGYGIASSEYNPLSTDAKSVKGFVTQIQAGLAFDELKKMRQESKTGGALGSVSNIEINLLQSAIAALDPSAPNFGDQLRVVRQHYQNFKDAILGREPSSGTNYRKIDGILYYIDPNEVGSDGKAKVYNLNNIASSVAAGQRVAVPTPFSYELEANFSQEGQK